MKLSEFMEEEMSRLKLFHMWYLEERLKDPESYPYEMDAGEWDEALLTFTGE